MMAVAESPTPTSKPDQRADARHDLHVDVTIASDTHFFAGLSGDVSRGGIFIATYADIPVGQRIFVQLKILDHELAAVGTVRWRREAGDSVTHGIGIRFDDLKAEALALIEQSCAERPPMYVDESAPA